MEEIDQDNKASSSLFSRYRSPSFRQAEVKALVELIEKHKYTILNKSTNSAANYAKEKAWGKIAKEFNKQGLGLERSMDVLKTKWDNLKRSARKLAKDVMDDECDFKNDEINKTVMLICSAENGNEFDEQRDGDNFEDVTEDLKPWACDDDNDSISFTLDEEKIQREIQNQNPKKFEVPTGFSPRDCRVLLDCVRQEKNILFSKTSFFKRHQAWKRIAESYNSQSPRRRTPKELNRKFTNMKAMAKKINIKGFFKDMKRKNYEHLNNDVDQKIKSEAVVDRSATDFEFDSDDDKVLCNPIELNHGTNNNHLSFIQDPLNNAHNSDSGLGSISETKDVARLKVELLNYKMENARLQRKRIEDLLRADEKEREMRSLEHSLRLRTARLEAVAAELKLPPSHPALKYTIEEQRAQQYMSNAQLDIG